MANLYQGNVQEAKKDTYRLLGVRLDVPTDEIIQKWQAKREDGSTVDSVPISLGVEWEPLSYKIEGSEFGNKEFDRVRLTKSGGVSLDALAAIRAGGYLAIPQASLYKTPNNPAKANPAKQAFEIQRLLVAFAKCGIDLSIDENGSVTGKPGEIYTKDAGQIFECSAGFEEFPTWEEDKKDGRVKANWEETKQTYMRLPLARVKDYVQPENVPVRHIERRDDDGGSGTAATVSGGGSGNADVTELLRTAVEKIGIVGKTVDEVNSSAMSLVARNLATSPVLGTSEIANAARGGKFVEVLFSKDAIGIADGVVVAA